MGIDIKQRKATLLDGDDVKTYLSTIRTSALAAARVLSLPLTLDGKNPNVTSSSSSSSSSADPTLQRTLPSFANKMVYVASFRLSQADIFRAVQQATRTTDADWDISHVPLTQDIQDAHAKLAAGNRLAIMDLLNGNLFVKGVADAFYPNGADEEAELHNALLGVEDCQNLEDVMARIVKEVMSK